MKNEIISNIINKNQYEKALDILNGEIKWN